MRLTYNQVHMVNAFKNRILAPECTDKLLAICQPLGSRSRAMDFSGECRGDEEKLINCPPAHCLFYLKQSKWMFPVHALEDLTPRSLQKKWSFCYYYAPTWVVYLLCSLTAILIMGDEEGPGMLCSTFLSHPLIFLFSLPVSGSAVRATRLALQQPFPTSYKHRGCLCI